jgi:hypothetical protein
MEEQQAILQTVEHVSMKGEYVPLAGMYALVKEVADPRSPSGVHTLLLVKGLPADAVIDAIRRKL